MRRRRSDVGVDAYSRRLGDGKANIRARTKAE